MTELVMVMGRNKAEIVDALKTKLLLDQMGVGISGIVMKKNEEENIPPEFVEDLLRLKVMPTFSLYA